MPTSILKPPTRAAGYVDENIYYSVLGDVLENVADVQWPTSNFTYAQMRRDPQLTAVLKAYTLLIRRATWTVDPTGCRPEVAKRVADDTGLPVAGTDVPGAARVRGVSWRHHLKSALLNLVYGHMGFAMQADVSSGQARLVALADRMPHTITDIRVDGKTGDLLGIDQGGLSDSKRPEIRASELVWYTHDREGASYHGTSLLRPAYAPWLLKREMLRVLATGNRRFSMGVPTVEWAPGTTPTPAQMIAAQQAASAARVGDQSGMSMPPGALLKLVGLTGSAPDTLAFIKFLDQQMSRMALAGHLDLGETSNGSRALGEAFVELLMLAEQSVGDDLADDATRQISARIVAWNEGEDEPVPRIICGDVGEKHDVTAEAIKSLLDSGALTADPGLEAFLRRKYRLPPREDMALPAPSIRGDTVAAANRPRRRSRREPSDGQLELPLAAAAAAAVLNRELTAEELAAGIDFDALHNDWLATRDDLWAQWPDLAAPIVDDLAQQVELDVDAGDLAALGALAVTPAVVAAISAALLAGMAGLATSGAASVVAEAAHQGVTLTAGVADAVRLQQTADATAALIASGYANAATRTALLNAGTDIAGATVADAVRTQLDAMAEAEQRGWVVTNLGSALQMAQAAGRMATFELSPDGTAFYAAERLDGGECLPCHEIDGHKFESLADAAAAYPAGKYRACLGVDRCRGHVFALFGTG